MRLNNRWFQLGASLVAMIMIANLQYSWTLFVNPLQKGTGWKLSDIQFAFTLFILCQTWASGIIAAGFGGGTALFIPVISSTIESRGYQAAFISTGLFQGIVIAVVAQFLRHPPREAASAAVKPADSTSQLGKRQFTTAEMMRTPQFYAMYVAFFLMSIGGLLVTAQAGPIARTWGYSTGVLTLAASLSPLANGGSRIFWGWASDKIGRETAMIIAFILQAICLLLVVALGQISGALFAFSLVLVYFTWGEIYSLFPATAGDYFGTRHATSNYGVLYTAKGVASIAGGYVGALLYEQFGTWSVGFYGSAALALVAAALAFGLRAASAPRHAPVGVAVPAKQT
jgi:OFA family oxalate/formate antiporter-like MFS transporter